MNETYAVATKGFKNDVLDSTFETGTYEEMRLVAIACYEAGCYGAYVVDAGGNVVLAIDAEGCRNF